MTWANRGQALETLINYTNQVYYQKGLAVVNKRPTPVKIVKTKGTKVLSAYLEAPSTVDFEGVYKGHSLQFEAKSTKSSTSFPMKNFHQHQIDHLKVCRMNGAVTFAIVEFAAHNQVYYVPGQAIEEAWERSKNDGRKSIPYDEFEHGFWLVHAQNGVPVDYLEAVEVHVKQMEESRRATK